MQEALLHLDPNREEGYLPLDHTEIQQPRVSGNPRATIDAEGLFPAEGGGTVAEATCGVVSLAVRGAVLAPVIEGRMSSTTTMSYVQVGGRQRLERFEGEPREALEASFGGGPFEQAGLSLSVTQTSAEPIEINWFV